MTKSVRNTRTLDPEGLRFLAEYAGRHRGKLAAALGVALALALCGGAIAWTVKELVEALAGKSSGQTVMAWVVLAVAAVMAHSVFEIVNRVLLTTLFARINQEMRLHVFHHIQKNPMEFFTHARSGEVASLLGNDAQAASAGVVELFGALWENPARIVFLLGVMFYFNPLLSVMVLVVIPCLAWAVGRISGRARKVQVEYLEGQGKLVGNMMESIMNVRQIRAFGLEQQQTDRLEGSGEDVIKAVTTSAFLSALVSPVTEFTGAIAMAAMAAVAWWQLENGMTATGAVAGCIAAVVALRKPVKSLSTSFVEMQRAFAAIKRLKWALEQGGTGGVRRKLEGMVNEVALRNVGFSYDGRRRVLNDVNMVLRRGERVAIVGPSGSGKTTLLDLVTGFYPCTTGNVLLDGADLSGIDAGSWRRQVGIVSQEPFLFDASIEENIRHGYQSATGEQVAEAARKAGCDEMLKRLPDGMATRVGERGCRLSGGERKRVAMARALVRPVSLLVLDEATSELDAETEDAILKTIDDLADGMMILHVSHRPSVLSHCDRALNLRNGLLRDGSAAVGGAV